MVDGITKKKLKLLVITNIDKIDNLLKKLENKFDIIYFPDPSFEDLEQLDCKIKDEVNGIFTNPNKSKIKIDKKILNIFKNINFICTASTGTVHIDEKFCKKNSIEIISLKKEIKVLEKVSSTAELAFLLLLSSYRDIISATNDVKNGNWDCDKFIGRQVNHLNIGVIGYGRLGKIFVNYARAFGAEVFIYDPYVDQSNFTKDINFVSSLSKLCNIVDAISLHVHVNNETKNMINRDMLKNCKNNVSIINTSRGEIVNESDILEFLSVNKKSKYYTDVISNEINSRIESPIYNAFINKTMENQILITPHIGGMTQDAREIAYHHAADLLIDNFPNE